MENFTYYAPTKVVFGRDTVAQTGQLARAFGANKVLVLYGGGSAVKSGLLQRVCDVLTAVGLPYALLGGIQPNPRLSKVYEGIDLGRREGVDFLLAVGGGSVIDTAKAVGYGMANDFDVWELYAKRAQAAACLPIGAVVTIAAAGSEMSNSSVITRDDGLLKRGYSSNLGRPRFAVMDPALTFTLPPYQTASGCVDILMHTMERYFHPGPGAALTDVMAEALMGTVLEKSRILMDTPTDYDARAEVMWAGSLSHNDLFECGTGTHGDWACHQMEHELSGMFDVAHGAGLAAIWGSWARYVLPAAPERFDRFARRVMGVGDCGDPLENGRRGIAAFEAFLSAIRMPVNLRQLGLTPSPTQLDALADSCSYHGGRTIGAIQKLDRADIRRIYQNAL